MSPDPLRWAWFAIAGSARRSGRRPSSLGAIVKSRLRQLRAERGWSQTELATRLGVSRQTVSSIERERYEPSLSLACKIARLLGRAIEDVFEAP